MILYHHFSAHSWKCSLNDVCDGRGGDGGGG